MLSRHIKKLFKRFLFQSVSFRIDGHLFKDPCLLNRKSNRTLSKAGSLIWRAKLDGTPVKIYNCFNEQQAILIEYLSNNSILHNYFPICKIRIGTFLVVSWVEGKQLNWIQILKNRTLFNEVVEMQSLFHRQLFDFPKQHEIFEYTEYLKRRLRKYQGILPINKTIQQILCTLDKCRPQTPIRVSHPDITASNLILESNTGNLKVIDNELLSQNNYYLIDLFNTVYSVGNFNESKFLENYLKIYIDSGGQIANLIEHEKFYNALWNLRLIGSSLENGNIGKAFKLTKIYLNDFLKSHPLIKMIKEKFI